MSAATDTWLFDLGNSRLKFASLQDDRIGDVVAITHDGTGFAPGWEQGLPARFDIACIATVAGDALSSLLLDALAARCKQVSVVRTQASLAGVRIAYAQPHRLGVDRFLALLAARERAQRSALVVGVGTALTVDLLDACGLHLGGRIAASPSLMRAALQARAPLLPERGGVYQEFATDTDDALVSGCDGAALGLITRSLDEAARLLQGIQPDLLLHGGGAPALLPRLPQAVHVPELVLQGLAQWARTDRIDGT